MTIVTNTYTTSSQPYIREIFRRWVMKRIWFIALFMAAMLALAVTVDAAFMFVALMVAFIVVPMVLSMVYFNYGLKPEARRWMLPRRVELDSDDLVVEYEPTDDGRPVPKAERYPLNRVIDLSTTADGDVIRFGRAPDDFIVIGNSAFSESDERKQECFRSLIYQSIQDNLLNLRS